MGMRMVVLIVDRMKFSRRHVASIVSESQEACRMAQPTIE